MQVHTERILGNWVDELKVPIYRGREVTAFAQNNAGVEVEVSDGTSLRAKYLVGCDGGRSLVRKAAGIEFPGWDPTTSHLIAEVEITGEPEWGLRNDGLGIRAFSKAGGWTDCAGVGDGAANRRRQLRTCAARSEGGA